MDDRNKLGYETNREREHIRQHLKRRGLDPKSLAFEFRVTQIWQRIHRYKPTMRQRQEAMAKLAPKPTSRLVDLTFDEIEYLRELFEQANHPLAKSIIGKL